MKHDNALPVARIHRRDSRACYLSRVRSLLNAIRARHWRMDAARQVDAIENDCTECDDGAPSLHDLHANELEASVHSPSAQEDGDRAIRHDSPAELARARRVFAATWMIPLLAISTALATFGSALDRPLFALLQSSVVALAIPLAGSGAALLYRSLKRRSA